MTHDSTQRDAAAVPRYYDPNSASKHPIQISWDQNCAFGVLDSPNAGSLEIVMPIDSRSPSPGTLAQLTLVSESNSSIISGIVESIVPTYGSLNTLKFRVVTRSNSGARKVQRRANTRFKFSPIYPLFALLRHPAKKRTIPMRALDVSNGGISFSCIDSDAAQLFEGVQATCLFEAPAIGKFRASIILRAVNDQSSNGNAKGGPCRIAAEFVNIGRTARSVLIQCLLSPMAGNSVADLMRENLLLDEISQFTGAVLKKRHLGSRTIQYSVPERPHARVEWAEYAQAYDVMCSSNPAYQENLSLFRSWIGDLNLGSSPHICDVGAGTGNYVIELAKRFPEAIVTHIDSDPMMNRTASRKYRAHALSNIAFKNCAATDADVNPGSMDLVVCVNALYSFGDAERAIELFHQWLRPNGHLFIIDLGRPMNVNDWARYIVRSSLANVGFAKTVAAFAKGRKAIGQNRRIRREQDRGAYWLHTSTQLEAALARVGFGIRKMATCYRDVCDLAICQKSST